MPQKQVPPKHEDEQEVPAPKEQEQEEPNVSTLDEDTDDILTEIDGVLEENAEEFVKSYIQKGGE